MNPNALEIDETRLRSELAFPLEVVRLEETDSTNNEALARPAAERRLIWTPRQTAGRGRGNNVWEAKPGCLTFTFVEPSPKLTPQSLPTTSLFAALAMADALAPAVQVQLKWPNDVYANDRKLCGILVENHPENALAVGVGINLCNDVSDLGIPAVNLIEAGARAEHIDATRLVAAWIRHFLDLLDLGRDGRLRLAEAWRPRCWLRGKIVTMDSGIRGRCLGIAPSGALRIEDGEATHMVYGGVVAGVSEDGPDART